jgi:hypothetical protein
MSIFEIRCTKFSFPIIMECQCNILKKRKKKKKTFSFLVFYFFTLELFAYFELTIARTIVQTIAHDLNPTMSINLKGT